MFIKLYKAVPIGPNVYLIKPDQHLEINNHLVFFENNRLVIDDKIVFEVVLPS